MMSVSTNRLALFASAAAFSVSLLAPAETFAAQAVLKTSATSPQAKENPAITAVRKNIHDAKNPARAGTMAVKDLETAWDNIRKAGLNPALGEGFNQAGTTENKYQAMKRANMRIEIGGQLAEARLPENEGIVAAEILNSLYPKIQALQESYLNNGEYVTVLPMPMKDYRELQVSNIRAAARQLLVSAVIDHESDPIKAIIAFDTAKQYMDYLPLVKNEDGTRDLDYASIETTKEIFSDIEKMLARNAAPKFYERSISYAQQDGEGYRDFLAAAGLMKRTDISWDSPSFYLALNTTPDDFVARWNDLSLKTAQTLIDRAKDPAFMGQFETIHNVASLARQIISAAKLEGVSEAAIKEIMAANYVAAANIDLQEVDKPENRGRLALEHMDNAREYLYTASGFVSDLELAQQYRDIKTLITNYSDVYYAHLKSETAYHILALKDRTLSPKAMVGHLEQIERIARHNELRDQSILADLNIIQDNLDAAKKISGLAMAEAALKVARENDRQNRPVVALRLFRDIKLGLSFAGVDPDEEQSFQLIHSNRAEFNRLYQAAACKLENACVKPNPAPATPSL